jgi:hypothetical protein
MATVAPHPVLRSPNVFSTKQKRQHPNRFNSSDFEIEDIDKLERRQRHAQEVEEASIGRAQAYVEDFLNRSEWSDQLDSITVHWDAIPTMEELESYGTLDATEGTRMCRRYFTAVVVWDDLGHGLWMRLKKTSEQRKAALKGLGPMLRMGALREEREQGPTSSGSFDSTVSGSGSSGLGRRESNESTTSGKSRSSSRSSTETRSAIPKLLRGIIRKQSS